MSSMCVPRPRQVDEKRREREPRDEAVPFRPGVPRFDGGDETPDQERRDELHADEQRHAQDGQD